MSEDPIPFARVQELLAVEQRKRRNVQLLFAVVVLFLLLAVAACIWRADQQAAMHRAERARAEMLEAQVREAQQVALEQARKADEARQEARTLMEVEDALRAAEVRKKLNAFVEPREPAPTPLAPPPRAVGP